MVNLDTYTGPGSVLKRAARAANKRPRRVSGGYSKSCTAEGCTENATFGYEQSAGLRRRECCERHKLPGMVDLAAAAESAGAAEASKRQSSSVEKRQTRARSGGGGGSVNGWSIGSSDESTEGDGHSEEEGDNDSDYEEKGWEEEAGEDEEEAAGPQRRSGERCKTSGCDKAPTFGFRGGACVSCPEHHRGGMLNLHFCYQNLPKRRYPSKRKRAEQEEEEEEEEEEEVDVGIEQSTEYSPPEAAARDGQPHMRNKKKPRGTAVDGAAVTAGPGGGDGDGGSGGSGAAAAVRAGVAGDSSEADIASVGGGAGSPNHQGVGWLVGDGGGGGDWGGGGGADGADDGRPVPMGVSDEACFEGTCCAVALRWLCRRVADTSPGFGVFVFAKARLSAAIYFSSFFGWSTAFLEPVQIRDLDPTAGSRLLARFQGALPTLLLFFCRAITKLVHVGNLRRARRLCSCRGRSGAVVPPGRVSRGSPADPSAAGN